MNLIKITLELVDKETIYLINYLSYDRIFSLKTRHYGQGMKINEKDASAGVVRWIYSLDSCHPNCVDVDRSYRDNTKRCV